MIHFNPSNFLINSILPISFTSLPARGIVCEDPGDDPFVWEVNVLVSIAAAKIICKCGLYSYHQLFKTVKSVTGTITMLEYIVRLINKIQSSAIDMLADMGTLIPGNRV